MKCAAGPAAGTIWEVIFWNLKQIVLAVMDSEALSHRELSDIFMLD